MKHIDHLPAEEQKHYTLCDCGCYVDMRDLSEVLNHLHIKKIAAPEWDYSIRKGEPAAYPRKGSQMYFN